MERIVINPMYGMIPVRSSENYIIRPSIESIRAEMRELKEGLENHFRNLWVQEIKANYRRNKRKRMRCKRKSR